MFKWRAGAVRRSCTYPPSARAHGSQQPNSTGHEDTQVEAPGWLHDVGGTPWLNTRGWLRNSGWESRLKLVLPTGDASKLRRLVMLAGYDDWLRRPFTTTGYTSWLRRLVKVMNNWSAWRGDNRSRDEERTRGNDEGTRWRDSEVTKWSDEVTR